MSNEVEHRETGQLEHAMSVENVMAQVRTIQELMKKAMKPGEHYGIIPGTSRKDKDGKEMAKPSLLKPGAEKIGMMFRLAPSYTGQDRPVEYPGGHLEYRLTCTLTNIRTGEVWGQGVGSCSTMETKYRFRNQKMDTGLPIPEDYKANKGHYRAQGFVAAKDENDQWIWAKLERVEHDNPADYYNTVLKMAKKRAQVDAVLTATAASDCFTQDLEDLDDNGLIHGGGEPARDSGAKADPPATPIKPMEQPAQEAGNAKKELFELLRSFCLNDQDCMADRLENLTSFTNKEGRHIRGKRSIDAVSGKAAAVAIGNLRKMIDSDQREPGQDD
jgi:hypothetical protein